LEGEKTMKKVLVFLVVIMLLGSWVWAQQAPKPAEIQLATDSASQKSYVNINGANKDVNVFSINNVDCVPLAEMTKALGMELRFDNLTHTYILMGDPDFSKYPGLVTGDVNFTVPKSKKAVSFENCDIALTAPCNDPDLDEAFRWHFYGKDKDYFIAHKSVVKAKVNKDGKFIMMEVPPGAYDLVLFQSVPDAAGVYRMVWKERVFVNGGQNTRVSLDKYNTAADYYRFLQK
jgi:hypothetical protein